MTEIKVAPSLAKLAKLTVERMTMLGYTGKKREIAAFEFAVGYVTGLPEGKEKEFITGYIAMVFAVRGWFEFKRLANEAMKEAA